MTEFSTIKTSGIVGKKNISIRKTPMAEKDKILHRLLSYL